MQLLQNKLRRTSSVLDSCLDIAREVKNHAMRLTDLGIAKLDKENYSEIEVYVNQLMQHRRSIRRIIKQSKGAKCLVCSLFSCTVNTLRVYPDSSQLIACCVCSCLGFSSFETIRSYEKAVKLWEPL